MQHASGPGAPRTPKLPPVQAVAILLDPRTRIGSRRFRSARLSRERTTLRARSPSISLSPFLLPHASRVCTSASVRGLRLRGDYASHAARVDAPARVSRLIVKYRRCGIPIVSRPRIFSFHQVPYYNIARERLRTDLRCYARMFIRSRYACELLPGNWRRLCTLHQNSLTSFLLSLPLSLSICLLFCMQFI